MRHKLFEAVLCEKLKCTSRDISRHLQRVQSLSIHDTTLSLVYRSESGQLFSEDTQVVAEMLMQDISQFKNLKDISVRSGYSPSDFGNKLFIPRPQQIQTGGELPEQGLLHIPRGGAGNAERSHALSV